MTHHVNQDEMLSFVRSYYTQTGVTPTTRQIQAQLGISSTSVVQYHLKQLERRGLLRHVGERGYVPPVVEELQARVVELEKENRCRHEATVSWMLRTVELSTELATLKDGY